MWNGKEGRGGVHWTSRHSMSKSNGEGGWSLKYIHAFGTSLEAETLWNLITKDNLWNRMMEQKYYAPDNILTWISEEETKSWKNGYLHSKALVSSFNLISNQLA